MAEKRTFRKSGFLYILSGLLLVAAVAGFFFWRNYKYRLVDKTLDKLVTGKSKGLYHISYGSLVINEAIGSISMKDIELVPDTLTYDSMLRNHIAPDNLFFIRIPELEITGVQTPKALLNKEIRAHLIRIVNPVVELQMRELTDSAETEKKKNADKELYRQMLGNLKSIAADSVIMENTRFTLTAGKSHKLTCSAIGLDIRLAAISIDSLNHLDTTRIGFAKDVALHCESFLVPDSHQQYTLTVNGFDFSSQTGNCHLAHLSFKQKLSETQFAKSHPFATDRFDIETGPIDIRHIDRQAMLRQSLMADTMQLSKAMIKIFRDKSHPHDSVDRSDAYPQQSIMHLPMKMRLKKIVVRNSYVEYKEKNDLSDSSGKVAFQQVNAVLSNVTNMPVYIRADNHLRLLFTASFLDRATLMVKMDMRLNDPNGNFDMEALMGPLPATALNPLLKPMALAEFSKGEIHRLHYTMHATNRKANGVVQLTYDDFSIRLLKKDDDKNKYKTKVLPTLAAGILLKESNPSKGKMRSGTVDFDRDVHRSIFNMMWKSLYSGIKQVAM